jgi:EAL domain-containing protein (putative c-di-GMP-specific phosphodiesterase class I)
VVEPDSFVPTAERLGLIEELDLWVVRNAVEAMAAHGDREGLSLELNLSGRSIGSPDMLERIVAEITSAEVDPRRLIFEVTETAAIANLEQAARFGRELLELGCGFALDDFGTGFASFYYLKRLPLTHLKIDGDFIRGLAASPVDQLVVRAIVEIAGGMGLKTIAEYVEDAPTLELLREFGVDYCQGYAIGPPAPPDPPDRMPPPYERRS